MFRYILIESIDKDPIYLPGQISVLLLSLLRSPSPPTWAGMVGGHAHIHLAEAYTDTGVSRSRVPAKCFLLPLLWFVEGLLLNKKPALFTV